MQISTLKASKREIKGKEISKKLRRQGLIPAVVYGDGVNISVQIESKVLSLAVAQNPSGHPIVELEVDGSDFNSHVILKETQRDPISGNIIHVDFLKVDMTKKLSITVPIKITGKSKGVIEDGGLINLVHRQLDIEAFPNAIPETVEVDITELRLNESIHISDLKLSDDVTILEEPGIAIVSVVAPKVEVKEEEVVEGEEGEEGAAEGAEGEAKEGGEEAKAEGKSEGGEAKDKKSGEKDS